MGNYAFPVAFGNRVVMILLGENAPSGSSVSVSKRDVFLDGFARSVYKHACYVWRSK